MGGGVELGVPTGPVLTVSSQLSAQKPAPIVGVSPIRPDLLFVRPPVLVATARLPHVSRQTAPTVP